MSAERDGHLFGPGPKRVLSLDGGGVRGILTLAFLERVEAILAERTGRPDSFRLCNYFDLIGGTSTGAVIATGLALGYSARNLTDIYCRLCHTAFRGSRWHGGILAPKFKSTALRGAVRQFVGNETLGSDKLRTGLAIVAKRIDTGSIWVFHNNPRGRFFDPRVSQPDTIPNRTLLLADLLRASTAAPTYFAPEYIKIADGQIGAFLDGGVSPHNNPAIQLLLLAALDGYGYRWPLGKDRLLMLSIGTGTGLAPRHAEHGKGTPAALLAVEALRSIMADCSALVQTLLQSLSQTSTPWYIDSEIREPVGGLTTGRPLLSYLRYDAPLDSAWLERLGHRVTDEELERLAEMDRPEMVESLLTIGRRAAETQVKPEHFPPTLDIAT